MTIQRAGSTLGFHTFSAFFMVDSQFFQDLVGASE
jgi:hypothetical protein